MNFTRTFHDRSLPSYDPHRKSTQSHTHSLTTHDTTAQTACAPLPTDSVHRDRAASTTRRFHDTLHR
eukprot:1319405-Prymnesium_polylepis.1